MAPYPASIRTPINLEITLKEIPDSIPLRWETDIILFGVTIRTYQVYGENYWEAHQEAQSKFTKEVINIFNKD